MTRLHLALLGDSGAGKTIFCHLLNSGKFSKVVSASIGTEFHTFQVGNTEFCIYDIACNKAYTKYMSPYLKRADAVLIFHDATKEEQDVNWLGLLRQHNTTAKVFHVRVKIECSTKISSRPLQPGVLLGDLALSQQPDLTELFHEILRHFKKPKQTFLQRIGFRGLNSGGVLLQRES